MQDQKNTLAIALEKLQALHLNAEQVRRVAVASQGTLHIEVHQGEMQRFFVYDENELTELQAKNDSKIPLLSISDESDFMTSHAIISYRPGRRVVLEPVNDNHGGIVKAYRKHKSARAVENYAVALSACEQGGFDIPGLLRYESQDDYLVMARRTGKSPLIASDATAVWGGIGSSLHRFHCSQVVNDLEEFSSRDELLVLDERARRFLLCMPCLPRGWKAGRERLETAVINLPPALTGLAHRDLHDGQFIVAGNTISLLDFDLICSADIALDAGNLLAHMKLRALQRRQDGDNSALTDCRKAFLFGLGKHNEPGFDNRLNFYQATTFYRLALLYALRPRWSHLAGPLTAEGNRCIDVCSQHRNRS